MNLPIIRAAARIENSDEHHLARLLILLKAGGGRKGTKPVAGIMKLAKLDFLLRYPNCLERVLKVKGFDTKEADIKPFERDSIEAKMIRFKYGPWDERYRHWIGLLVGKGLATTYLQGRTIYVGLTDKGHEVAKNLEGLEEFQDIEARSDLVIRTVGELSATRLKEFVYQTFPEILSMEWGEEIKL